MIDHDRAIFGDANCRVVRKWQDHRRALGAKKTAGRVGFKN
jgi:hypothetical protein